MQWMIENWLLLLVGGGMLAMHLFGHGHGHGHGHRRGHKNDGDAAHHGSPKDTELPDEAANDRSEEDRNA